MQQAIGRKLTCRESDEGCARGQVGLELLVDHAAADPGQWAVIGAYYGGQLFANTSALLDAWRSPGSSHLTRMQARARPPGTCPA